MLAKYKYDFCIPQAVKTLLNTLHKNGYEAYIVGGCVRDLLLKHIPKDYDITTNATPEQIKEVFNDLPIVNNNGEKHGTVTVRAENENYEITTYRIDSEYKDHRHPDFVEFTTDLEKDLSRRDFTVNALVYDGVNVLDYFNGVHDLDYGHIRAVGDPSKRFEEDALRILRMIRFASVLGFDISGPTLIAAYKLRATLKYVSKERIREEVNKIICGRNFSWLATNAVVIRILAEILPIDKISFDDYINNLSLVAALLWPYSPLILKNKYESTNPSILALIGLFRQNKQAVIDYLSLYRYSNDECVVGKTLLNFFDSKIDLTDKISVKTLLWKMSQSLNTKNKAEIYKVYRLLLYLEKASMQDHAMESDTEKKWYEEAKRVLEKIDQECFLLSDLRIKGEDILALGIAPGPKVKEILNTYLQAVIEEKLENNTDVLIEKLKKEIR